MSQELVDDVWRPSRYLVRRMLKLSKISSSKTGPLTLFRFGFRIIEQNWSDYSLLTMGRRVFLDLGTSFGYNVSLPEATISALYPSTVS